MKGILYYIVQWTWGIIMNLIGAVAFGALMLVDTIYYIFHPYHLFRAYRHRKAICVVLPWHTGAISLGMFMIRGKYIPEVCSHEYGHSIQNMQWGPLFLFVIGLPSLFRCWYRDLYMKFIYGKKSRKILSHYDSIWFEGQATEYGKKADDGAWSWI